MAEITNDRRWAWAVSAIVVLRIVCGALLLLTFIIDRRPWTVCIFFFACLTDAVDGQLTKRLDAYPSLGPYADPTADFILVLAAFSAFVMKGVYPPWLLVLIAVMFLQFIVTSGLRQPLYDPVGKCYGVFLFAAIGVTLLVPRPAVYTMVLGGILGFTVASLASRSVFLLSRRKKRCISQL